MLGLYLLAAHMAGDFLLQNRWQAASKLGDRRARFEHCVGYTIPFVALVLVVGAGPLAWYAFPVCLFALHYLTDSHRFQSTIGDVVQWRIDCLTDPETTTKVWLDYLYGPDAAASSLDNPGRVRAVEKITAGGRLRFPPPNPWPAMPLMIDQSLHICQLAILGGLLLR